MPQIILTHTYLGVFPGILLEISSEISSAILSKTHAAILFKISNGFSPEMISRDNFKKFWKYWEDKSDEILLDISPEGSGGALAGIPSESSRDSKLQQRCFREHSRIPPGFFYAWTSAAIPS